MAAGAVSKAEKTKSYILGKVDLNKITVRKKMYQVWCCSAHADGLGMRSASPSMKRVSNTKTHVQSSFSIKGPVF